MSPNSSEKGWPVVCLRCQGMSDNALKQNSYLLAAHLEIISISLKGPLPAFGIEAG